MLHDLLLQDRLTDLVQVNTVNEVLLGYKKALTFAGATASG